MYPLNAELALNTPVASATTIREPVPARLDNVVTPLTLTVPFTSNLYPESVAAPAKPIETLSVDS